MSTIYNGSVTDGLKREAAKLKVVVSTPESPLVVSDEKLIALLKDANKKLGDHARLLTDQRDELLTALESLIDMDVSYQRGRKVVEAVENAIDTIARVKAQQ